MSEIFEPKIISGSRGKAVLYLVGSLALFWAGATIVPDTDFERVLTELGLVLFGLCLPLFGWLIIRPQSLRLNSCGFTLCGGLVRSQKQVLWADIDGFFVHNLPKGNQAVAYNFRPGAKTASPLTRISKKLGAKALLPGIWPLSAEQMVETLNVYRLQALSREPEQSSEPPLSGGGL
ncbi:hypothetical protein FJW07_18745 [Mesorhizobium sp. B3-1-9]|uniref:hypothetical protein n=1 Tax=unclassified Mesorhizobium TaxID=325217 RepID=UPI001129C81F|nr:MULTISPECIES: hypothetical protein [unclassified Mesorhizobium]TPI37139.1 hypothetical protein FJW07_18745 [Mesorhizobium sp. B3-1-9]TPI47838.1 hypothetical protein FJ417_31250 [Mesorhizobium sp. B3-1-7]